MQDLPGEIWQEIFSHLSNTADIKNCSLVSRSWYLVASEKLWDKQMVTPQPSNVELFRMSLKGKLVFALKVKHMKYEGTFLADEHERDTAIILFHALIDCTNLEELIIRLFNFSNHVLKMLNGVKNMGITYEPILPRLKGLFINTSCDYKDRHKSYASICYQFRYSLTRLDLYSMNNYFEELKGLYHYLMRFPNLQELNFQQETIISNVFFQKPPLLIDFDIPLLISSNKNLDTLRIDDHFEFSTGCQRINSSAKLTAKKRRSMKLIGARYLNTMEYTTLMYITEDLDIQVLATQPDINNDIHATTEIICEPDENPLTVLKQLDGNRQKIKRWTCGGIKYGNFTFYHPPMPKQI